jgi:hypothetical protein
MSFFKKLTEEFNQLKASFDDKPSEKDDKKDDKKEEKEEKKEEKKEDKPAKDESKLVDESTRDFNPSNPAPPYDQHQQPPAGYHQSQSGQQPPQHGYNGYSSPPPPQQHSPHGQPPLPPGWTAQWDQNSQRWYYVEQATGRT